MGRHKQVRRHYRSVDAGACASAVLRVSWQGETGPVSRVSFRRRAVTLLVPGFLVVASCHPGYQGGTPVVAAGEFPRCFAFDQNGDTAACRAPERVYDGDSCVCGDGHGRT